MRWLLLLLAGCTVAPEPLAEPEEPSPEARSGYALPIADPSLISGVIGVDHDPEVHDESTGGGLYCRNHDDEPFPACYDEHRGSDYLLDGGFEAMDAGSVDVLAAAPGVVIHTVDGNYDRCHSEGFEVSCDGYPMIANRVEVEHEDGRVTWYLHLMKDSVAVEIGDEVACGDLLGAVGSSGRSSTPHLHFQVLDVDGSAIDPYAGVLSQPESLWLAQEGPRDLPATDCQEPL